MIPIRKAFMPIVDGVAGILDMIKPPIAAFTDLQ